MYIGSLYFYALQGYIQSSILTVIFSFYVFFFSHLGRPPGPEMENCTDRESYSLAAGLALGLVMLGVSNMLPVAYI